MEKEQTSTKPMEACKIFYKSAAENCPFRSIRRLSHRPMSENSTVSPNQPGGSSSSSGSPSKSYLFLKKLVAPRKHHPGEVNIPIQAGPGGSVMINEKEKMANSSVSQQINGRVVMISSPKIQPAEKKPKQKAKTEIPPSNMIVVQGPGQGIKAIATPRTEAPAKPNMPKPKSQPRAASLVKVVAKQGEPTSDTKGKEVKKQEKGSFPDHNHKYSAYIDRVKNSLRTKSDINEETITAKPPTKAPTTRRDSFNDRVSNFITRARKNFKTTHLGD